MAVWTNVPDSVLEPGDPIRSVDIIAIKENPIAIAEGASGAPRIDAAALKTGNNERDWVLARTAGASVGAVGTYALLQNSTVETIDEGTTRAGSTLNYANVNGNRLSSPAGTWRLMGVNGYSGGGSLNTNNRTSVWLRIS